MEFDALLVAKGPGGAWTFLPIPFNVQEVFGTAERLAAAGTVNGFPFRNSLMPEGDGSHSMIFNKELQAGACAKAGDRVQVVLERDQGERQIATPAELEQIYFSPIQLPARGRGDKLYAIKPKVLWWQAGMAALWKCAGIRPVCRRSPNQA